MVTNCNLNCPDSTVSSLHKGFGHYYFLLKRYFKIFFLHSYLAIYETSSNKLKYLNNLSTSTFF